MRRMDWKAFHAALDGWRLDRGQTWKDVAAETGVHASSLSRLGRGHALHAEPFLAMLEWSGMGWDSFLVEVATPERVVPPMVALWNARH